MDNPKSNLFIDFMKLAKNIAVAEGLLIEEEGVILSPETIALVKEIEANQLKSAIDKALDQRDEAAFKKLVALCK